MKFWWANENCSFTQFLGKLLFCPKTCTKFGTMVEGHGNWSITKAQSHWSNGGAIALNWKCKLWTGIAQAPFDSQTCNLCPHMRLLMPYNFPIWIYDLWPLDLRPFWIIWKKVTIIVFLGFSLKVHETFYTWTGDLYGQIVRRKWF